MIGYVLTPLAERDLLEIGQHIAADSVARASRVVGGLRKAMNMLARQPLIGHERTDLAPPPYRFWPVYSYLIVYRPDVTPLPIIRVLHGARDVADLLNSQLSNVETP